MISARPRQVERALGAAALGDPGEHERHGEQADRDVDPEDPLPGEALGDGAADHRAARDREAGEALQRADRRAAALGREGGADERQRERHHERGAGALDGAGGDQRSRRRARARRRPRRARRATRPAANRRRRPKRSPSAEAVISSTAKLRL